MELRLLCPAARDEVWSVGCEASEAELRLLCPAARDEVMPPTIEPAPLPATSVTADNFLKSQGRH